MLNKIKNSGLIWLWISFFVLLTDILTKTWALKNLHVGEPLVILPILNFTLAFNTGAAFGFLNTQSGWQHILLGGLAILVSVWIVVWLYQTPRQHKLVNIALVFILGGALGNVLDRIRYGNVIDFLSFHIKDWYFAIFNIADSAICIGAVLLFFSLVCRKE